MISILRGLCDDSGVTVVTATHDHKMLKNSDRVLHIRDGSEQRIQRRDELQIEEGQIALGGQAIE